MFTPDHCQFERSRGEVLRVNTARTVDEHGVKFVLDRLARKHGNVLRRDVPCLPPDRCQYERSRYAHGVVNRNRKIPEMKHISSRFCALSV